MRFDLEVVELSDEDGSEYDRCTLEDLPSEQQAHRALEVEHKRQESASGGTYVVTPISGNRFELIDHRGLAYRRYRIKPAKSGSVAPSARAKPSS